MHEAERWAALVGRRHAYAAVPAALAATSPLNGASPKQPAAGLAQ
eukprot:CAMPEP_0204217660 /NCGR_PEP_ID=MMETSP0361-20130328/79060_1 /ASSEMBLY_ACC=CAM_ASM_000343 /TAXON_ID=268821 /ORGANISM="Scrippsiella Hangoei, Strain SHTV-5" /LENGTH=44 /DNA_ID= /DNA_START= /DNA_END= /DNA_ORIENTATION=